MYGLSIRFSSRSITTTNVYTFQRWNKILSKCQSFSTLISNNSTNGNTHYLPTVSDTGAVSNTIEAKDSDLIMMKQRISSAGVDWRSDHLIEYQHVFKSHMLSRQGVFAQKGSSSSSILSLSSAPPPPPGPVVTKTLSIINEMTTLEGERRVRATTYEETIENKKRIGSLVADAKKQKKKNAAGAVGLSQCSSSSSSSSSSSFSTTNNVDSNTIDAYIQDLMAQGEKNRVVEHEALKALESVEIRLKDLFSHFPNLLDDRVPEGVGSEDNIVVASHLDDQRLINNEHDNDDDNDDNDDDDNSSNSGNSSHSNDSNELSGSHQKKMKMKWLHHDDIAKANGWMDLDAANRMSGTRFNILTGNLVRLERELARFFLDFHTKRRHNPATENVYILDNDGDSMDNSSSSSVTPVGNGTVAANPGGSGGYTELSVPYIVSAQTLECTGHLPKFREDLFGISHEVMGQHAYLIPTAEVPITSMFMHQVLDSRDLPLCYVAHTPSFRAEAGAYGQDTRGIMRQHQFHKVELVTIATPETSAHYHEQMVGDVEALMQALGLPYRKVLLCSGDIGFAASMCYDIECWFPGQQAYREVSSISNCTDFQSKRLGFIATDNAFNVSRMDRRAKGVYPHTINGSGLAIGRALAAILENYQCVDGSVNLPAALIPYCPAEWNGKIPADKVVQKNTIRLTAKR